MDSNRKTATIVGALFIIATVAGILGLVFEEPILDDPNYLISVSENETRVIIGALFVLIMAVAVAGIGTVMYPILRKHNEAFAIGYVGARILEAVIDIVAVFSWLLLSILSQEYAKAGAPHAPYFQTLGRLLLAAGDWANHVILDVAVFPVGALIFYYLLYRSELIPRWLSVWGLIGAPLWLAGGLLAMFGHDPMSTIPILLNLPIGVNEMVLAVWLIVKGFHPSALVAESVKTDMNEV
jgi:hypothetical protein